MGTVLSTGELEAQQDDWRPNRIPPHSAAQPIAPNASSRTPNPAAQATRGEAGATRIRISDSQTPAESPAVLRWKQPSQRPVVARTPTPAQTDLRQTSTAAAAFSRHDVFAESPPPQAAFDQSPLQYDRPAPAPAVRTANYQTVPEPLPTYETYQEDAVTNPFEDSIDQSPLPSMQAPAPIYTQEQIPSLPQISPSDTSPDLPDPLDRPEPAPSPGGINPNASLPNSIPPSTVTPQTLAPSTANPGTILESSPQSDETQNPFADDEDANVPFFDRDMGQDLPPRGDGSSPDMDMPDPLADRGTISCNELRARIRARPIRNVSLDVSPNFGEGMRSVRRDTEPERLEFAASSQIRDWTDYKGTVIASGRMIDLRDDRVILDINGREDVVWIHDLSDADLAYIGDSWNIPLRCGLGNEAYAGRSFVPSAMQWKAPGHCHKPLYFQEVQLERYGHDAGPVMQPLISTAHFFANIAVLPYKMGIHPPHECQYSLGYIRPGNCAPYMLQPIPISLRGAAVQAGVVTGAAALIP